MRRILNLIVTLNLGLILLTVNATAQSLVELKSVIDAEWYESAISLAKRLLKAENSNGDAHFYLGEAYLKVNEPDSAKAIFIKGTQAFPKNPLNFVGLGQLALTSGNAGTAKDNFSLAVKVGTKRDLIPPLYIGMAYMEAEKPDFPAALAHLEKADKIDKKDKVAEIFTAFGDYYAYQNKSKEAVKRYSQALALNPDILRAKVQTAKVYVKSGEYAKADSLLKAVVTKNSAYGPAFRELSALYHAWVNEANGDQKHNEMAAEYYKKYLAITGNYYNLLVRYAELIYHAKDFPALEAQLTTLQTLASKNNRDVAVERLSAYSAYENKNYAKAILYFDTYFSTIKDHSLIISDDYLYFGRTQLKLGQEEKAVFNILKAVELDQRKAFFLTEVARYYYDRKNWPKAIEFYQKINDLVNDPSMPAESNIFYGTALFFRFIQEKERGSNPSKDLLVQADHLFKGAYAKSADNATAYLWSARILYLLEDPNARTWAMVMPYEKYVQLQEVSALPQTAATKRSLIEAYNVIADFALFKQDVAKASAYWNKALVLDPQNSAALAGMKSLAAKDRSSYN